MIEYLNTDLELVAAQDLAALVTSFEQHGLFKLHADRHEDGLWYANFETEESFEEPEPNIKYMLSTIESLPDSLASAWLACSVREFNIGYECGDEPWAFNQVISALTLQRIASVGAALRFTLYPPEASDRSTQSALT